MSKKTGYQKYIADKSAIVSNNVMHLQSKTEYAKACKEKSIAAKQCLECTANREGYCDHFREWAYLAKKYCKGPHK